MFLIAYLVHHFLKAMQPVMSSFTFFTQIDQIGFISSDIGQKREDFKTMVTMIQFQHIVLDRKSEKLIITLVL